MMKIETIFATKRPSRGSWKRTSSLQFNICRMLLANVEFSTDVSSMESVSFDDFRSNCKEGISTVLFGTGSFREHPPIKSLSVTQVPLPGEIVYYDRGLLLTISAFVTTPVASRSSVHGPRVFREPFHEFLHHAGIARDPEVQHTGSI